MKKAIVLFTVLLILWIAGCTYCYVCNIRDDCQADPVTAVSDRSEPEVDTLSSVPVKAKVPQSLILYFDFNESTVLLTVEDKQHLDEFKKYISENDGSVIDISGHSDPAGTQQVKLKISTQRARFLQQHLVAAGIEASRINISGKSDSEPATSDNTAAGNAKNRRAEIQIK